MKLYCVRHGETEFNAQGRIQGQTDTALSELGHRQSAALARGLVGLGIEAIVSYPDHQDEKYGSITKFLITKLSAP